MLFLLLYKFKKYQMKVEKTKQTLTAPISLRLEVLTCGPQDFTWSGPITSLTSPPATLPLHHSSPTTWPSYVPGTFLL